MIAYVTSIGEPTTDLCVWSLKRNGFDVRLVQNDSSLAEKLKHIYAEATDDFVRVDGDVIPNKYILPETVRQNDPEAWWVQYSMYDWFQQDRGFGGIQYIRKEALPYLNKYVNDFLYTERPETELSRIKEFHNPRRFISSPMIMGLHNYKNDIKRVAGVKSRRGQLQQYDFDLAQRINEL